MLLQSVRYRNFWSFHSEGEGHWSAYDLAGFSSDSSIWRKATSFCWLLGRRQAGDVISRMTQNILMAQVHAICASICSVGFPQRAIEEGIGLFGPVARSHLKRTRLISGERSPLGLTMACD